MNWEEPKPKGIRASGQSRPSKLLGVKALTSQNTLDTERQGSRGETTRRDGRWRKRNTETEIERQEKSRDRKR